MILITAIEMSFVNAPSFINVLSNTHFKLKNYKKALIAYEQASQIEYLLMSIFILVKRDAHYYSGNYNEASAISEKAISLEPKAVS